MTCRPSIINTFVPFSRIFFTPPTQLAKPVLFRCQQYSSATVSRTRMVVKDMPKVRMLVLETDTAHKETIKARGTFGQILHHHFAQAGMEHDPPLGVETDRRFVVAEEGGKVPTFDEVKDFDAILMTGSMFDAHGNNQWILDLLALLRGEFRRGRGPVAHATRD